jgi:putative two-component system response regulator
MITGLSPYNFGADASTSGNGHAASTFATASSDTDIVPTPHSTKDVALQAGCTASVLVVDDEPAVANVLARCLRFAGYDVAMAASGIEALEVIATRTFDVLLTDIHMPRMRGDEMQRIARRTQPELAVLLVTAAEDTSAAVECLKDGVYDYLTKPFDLDDVVVRVQKALERRDLIRENEDYRRNLEQRVRDQADQLLKTVQGSLEALINALEAKDPNTHNHSRRVAVLATELARRTSGSGEFAEQVQVAALLHDIGKIGVPEAILNKKGRLTDDEMEIIRKHPAAGATILAPIVSEEIVAMVRSHHERIDGYGYPCKLQGDAIPLGGRIIAVADAYDAMSSTRPYRCEFDAPVVLEIMRDGAGIQWDRDIVSALLAMSREGAIAERIP